MLFLMYVNRHEVHEVHHVHGCRLEVLGNSGLNYGRLELRIRDQARSSRLGTRM